MWHLPTLTEDAKHLSLVATSAIAAIAATAGLVALLQPEPAAYQSIEIYAGEAEWVVVPMDDENLGADRIYGRVITSVGEEVTGHLRWDGREASWADVLPATELRSASVAGLRFGHLASLTPREGNALRATLRSGAQDDLVAVPATGPTLSPMQVETVEGDVRMLPWSDITRVEFMPEPLMHEPLADRLHGTLVTMAGESFTGYVTWDLDESFDDEVLEGRALPVTFDQIASIRRASSGVFVETVSGASLHLDGTRDVDSSNRGILVADPGLGSVTVPFDRLRELRLHEPDEHTAFAAFDGGRHLEGVVRTEAGESLAGTVRWDLDESATWELLDGKGNGLDFHIEFSKIASIEKTWMGATVKLLDGRSFYLLASNDVNWTNRGIEVTTSDASRVVSWKEFARLELQPGG